MTKRTSSPLLKRISAALLAGVIPLSILASCDRDDDPDTSEPSSTSAALPVFSEDEPSGSGSTSEPGWTEDPGGATRPGGDHTTPGSDGSGSDEGTDPLYSTTLPSAAEDPSTAPGDETADEFVWWSDEAESIMVRQVTRNPNRYSFLRYDSSPTLILSNWSGFDPLLETWNLLTATIKFNVDLDRADFTITIEVDPEYLSDPLETEGGSDVGFDRVPTQVISGQIDFIAGEFPELSYLNIDLFSTLKHGEAWLYQKMEELRNIAMDIIISDTRYGFPYEQRLGSGMNVLIEQALRQNYEDAVVTLNYEPSISFNNPRELGVNNPDSTYGSLTLSHDLWQGQLKVVRWIGSPWEPDGGLPGPEVTLNIDFRSGLFFRDDRFTEDSDSRLQWVDYPSPVLYELAWSMRDEILRQIPGARHLIREQDEGTTPTGY